VMKFTCCVEMQLILHCNMQHQMQSTNMGGMPDWHNVVRPSEGKPPNGGTGDGRLRLTSRYRLLAGIITKLGLDSVKSLPSLHPAGGNVKSFEIAVGFICISEFFVRSFSKGIHAQV